MRRILLEMESDERSKLHLGRQALSWRLHRYQTLALVEVVGIQNLQSLLY